MALVEGLDIRQGLSLTWLGVVAVATVLAGLTLVLTAAGRVFIARARARARRLGRSQARPGAAPESDDAAIVAAIAVALAAAEEGGRHPLFSSANGTGPRAAWAVYGRERLMDNQPSRQGR